MYFCRLSKIVGDKVRDANPNIADLSDPNRPTEIGQKFSELYDNEWSDAFEEMNFKDDDRKVRSLLLIMEVIVLAFTPACVSFSCFRSYIFYKL